MTTHAIRRLLALGSVLMGFAVQPAFAATAPPGVPAFYLYGTTLAGLEHAAYTDGCFFAEVQPDTKTDLMILDFGAARMFPGGEFGAVDFSNTLFVNTYVLYALESAADGYHDCHVRGAVIIEYGNSNYHMSSSGMGTTDAWNAGYDQEKRAQDLSNYQDAHGYWSQGSGAASDMEPSYDGQLITKQLVNGASAQGWTVYDDFGSVDGCPTSGSSNGPCNNGWDVGDVGYVSFHGIAVPLPEIYYTVSANQWTVVRHYWDSVHGLGSYFFDGVTGVGSAPSGGLTGAQGWNALNARNPGYVGNNLVCFGGGC